MAQLTACKLCGKEMSTSAEVCPHCAHTHGKDRQENNNLKALFIWAGIMLLFVALFKLGYIEQWVHAIFSNLFKKP